MRRLALGCFVLFLFSCQEDEVTITQTERWLTSGRWELKYITESVYVEGAFDRVDTIRLNQSDPSDALTFFPNKAVEFTYRYYDTTILGSWQLSRDEVYLSTDLTLDVSPAAGSSDQHFYPYSKIAELSQDALVLQTDTVYWYYTYEEEDSVFSVPYSTIRASHFTH